MNGWLQGSGDKSGRSVHKVLGAEEIHHSGRNNEYVPYSRETNQGETKLHEARNSSRNA